MRSLELLEWGKDPWDVTRRYPGARVRDKKSHPILVRRGQRSPNRSALAVVFDAIDQEIQKDLSEAIRIGQHELIQSRVKITIDLYVTDRCE